MWTAIIVAVVAYIWWICHKSYANTGRSGDRRRRAAWSWAILGAIAGSFFGLAGFGVAIAGTIPGALVGYLLASNLMKRDHPDESPTEPGSRTAIMLNPQPPPNQASGNSAPLAPAVTFQLHPAKPKRSYMWLAVIALAAFIGWVVAMSKQSASPMRPIGGLVPIQGNSPPTSPVSRENNASIKSAGNPTRPKSQSDLRSCLDLKSTEAITRCAEGSRVSDIAP